MQAGFGSFNYLEGNLSANTSANTSAGQFAASVYANAIRSDGYRENNKLRQENAVGDLRWTNGQNTTAYLNISADNQHLGLPGGRLVTPTSSELVTDRRGAATPFDFGNKNGLDATLGVTHMLWQGTELVVDGGVRNKNQESGFFSAFGSIFDSGFKADLTSYSVTPRLLSQHMVGGMPGKLSRASTSITRSTTRPIAASGRSPDLPLRPEADDGRLLLPGDGRRTTRYRLRLRRPRAAQFHQCPRPVRSECAGRGVFFRA